MNILKGFRSDDPAALGPAFSGYFRSFDKAFQDVLGPYIILYLHHKGKNSLLHTGLNMLIIGCIQKMDKNCQIYEAYPKSLKICHFYGAYPESGLYVTHTGKGKNISYLWCIPHKRQNMPFIWHLPQKSLNLSFIH